jgi:hypothetical protein
MKKIKLITLGELLLSIILLGYIILRWDNTHVSVGDFFCLEVLAMLFWYEYDKFKTKIK